MRSLPRASPETHTLKYLPRLLAIGTVVMLSLAAGAAFAQVAPPPAARVLPDFDVRDTIAGRVAPTPQAQAALEHLRAAAPGPLRARFDRHNGAVRLLLAEEGFITHARSGQPADIAIDFLANHHGLFGLDAADLKYLAKIKEYRSHNEAVTHIWYDQVINGIPVFQAGVRLHVTDAGELAVASSTAVAVRRPWRDRPGISADLAVILAAADIRPELGFVPQLKTASANPRQVTRYYSGPFANDVVAQLAYFPLGSELRLAWEVRLAPVEYPQSYLTVLDAENGQILYRVNTILYQAPAVPNVTFKVVDLSADWFPFGVNLPKPNPTWGKTPDPLTGKLCQPPLDWVYTSLTNSLFLHPESVVGVAAGSDVYLVGNNAHVYSRRLWTESVKATKTTDPRLGDTWHFDWAFNAQESADTQLFFTINAFHDFFYHCGFDEAAGAFQFVNYVKPPGPGDGDGVNGVSTTEPDSGIVKNNAFFSTGYGDGSSAELRVFPYDGDACWGVTELNRIDGQSATVIHGEYDAGLIAHEYHHGVALRLGLVYGNTETGAIHEGGGDFFAESLYNNPTMSTYARLVAGGNRSVNDKTYASWDCTYPTSTGPVCEPHRNGEIWANVMWDIQQAFRQDSGVSGVHELHHLYVQALKWAPSNSTMLDLRELLLKADRLRNADETLPGASNNYCRIYQAFAGRGMGLFAKDTQDTGDLKKVVPNTAVPRACNPGAWQRMACDWDGNHVISKSDITAVTQNIGKPVVGLRGDPDGDSKITINDARICALLVNQSY